MTEFGLWVYNGGWWILLTVGVLLAMAAVMTGLVFNTKGLSDELSGRTRRREVERLKRKYAGMRDEDIEGRMRELVEPLETASDGPVASVPSPVSRVASAPVYGAVAPSYGAGAGAPVYGAVDADRGSVVAEVKASIYGYDEEDEEEKTGVFTPETPEEDRANTSAAEPEEDRAVTTAAEPVGNRAHTAAGEPEEGSAVATAAELVAQSAQFDAQGVELPRRAEEAPQAGELQRSKDEAQPAKSLESLTAEVPQRPHPGIPPLPPVTLEHEEEEETNADLTTVEDTEAETSADLSTVEDTEAETSADLTTVEDTEAETSADLTTVEDTEAETSADLTEDPTALQTQEEPDEYPTEEFKETSELPRVYLPDMPTSSSAIRLNTAGLGILAEAHSTGSYDPMTGETRKHNTVEGDAGTSFVPQS